jgi:hypothetical protein
MTPTGGSQTNRSLNSASNLSANWQADSTPPLTTLTDGPTGWTNEATPTFVFEASELGSKLECRVDSAAFQTCTSPLTTAALTDADHTFSVRAIDPAGNVDATPAVRSFQVDTVAPQVSVTCPATVVLGADASATVDASDARSGLAPEEDPSGVYPLDTTHAGTQSFVMDAFDRAGNKGTDTCSYEVLYEAPGTPEVTVGGNPNAGAFTVGWTEAAPASYGLQYVLQRRDADDDAWHAVGAGSDALERAFTAGDTADEGTWTYRAKGTDPDGLETPWSEASGTVVVDQTAPGAPVLSTDRDPEYAGDGGWFRDSVVVFTADSGDPALRDGSDPSGVDPASVAGPQTVAAGTTVGRTVSDRAGNESASSELPLQVDTADPSLELDCPVSVLLGGSATVNVTASDGQSGLGTDPSGTVDVDTSTAGTKTIERTATDNVGHTRTRSCDVLVRYDYGGLRQPVNSDGSSVFRLGSTVPLKLTLADAAGNSVQGAAVELSLERISTTVEGDYVEEVVSATPTNGKAFEYDADSGEYRFNLSTKPLSKGTWMLRITLDDGTVHRTRISLR